jgi:SAM-dependent methyltransferase
MAESWKSLIPWPVKIASKLVLSRLPVPYSVWSRLNLFKHGYMLDAGYAERVFLTHFEQLDPARRAPGFTCLELGPGDSLLSAVIAHKHGAARVYLVDVGAFAKQDYTLYREAAEALLPADDPTCEPAQWRSTADMLSCCNAEYLTEGVASLSRLDAASVDFCWSQAVLEHVRRHEFMALLREMRRVLRRGGVASHRVDLRDHLGGKLNNLRFSEPVWEGRLFSESGFYTNRLRYSEIVAMCRDAGFSVRSARPDQWPVVPTPRRKMAPAFQRFTDDDLRVHGFYLTLMVP